MTALAVGRESSLNMIGILRGLEVAAMTAIAIGRRSLKAVGVTVGAIQATVPASQGKEGVLDVEISLDACWLPRDRRVAELAFHRKARTLVIGTRRLPIISGMTGKTLDRGRRILEGWGPPMAAGTVDAGVGTCQRK